MKKKTLLVLLSLTFTLAINTNAFSTECCRGSVKSVDGTKITVLCHDGKEITVQGKTGKEVKAGDEVICKDGKPYKKNIMKELKDC